MALDYDKMAKAIEEFPNTPAGKTYFAKLKADAENESLRFKKLEKYLETHDFDELMDRFEKEHGEEWHTMCRKKGYQTYPNNRFNLLFKYITENYASVDPGEKLGGMFLSGAYFFKGYWFLLFCGQGCFHRVINEKREYNLTI